MLTLALLLSSGDDSYEEVTSNQYSIDIDALICKNNGEHGEDGIGPHKQLLDRLLNVARVNNKHKVKKYNQRISSVMVR